MNSPITEIYEQVSQLSKSLDSLTYLDKIERIEDTINGIKQQKKLLNSDNLNVKEFYNLREYCRQVVECLEKAKSTLQDKKRVITNNQLTMHLTSAILSSSFSQK